MIRIRYFIEWLIDKLERRESIVKVMDDMKLKEEKKKMKEIKKEQKYNEFLIKQRNKKFSKKQEKNTKKTIL